MTPNESFTVALMDVVTHLPGGAGAATEFVPGVTTALEEMLRAQPAAAAARSTDLVTPDNVSIERIHEAYDAAMMEVTLDEEKRFIRIKEDVVARCTLSESKERIMLVAYYGIKDEAQRIDRLELVNRINDQYVLIRASIDDDGDLQFDYCLVLKGGVSKKHIVQATRVFLMLVPKAVSECDEDGIVD